MEEQKIEELWADFVAGELSSGDEALLHHALADDSRRNEILADVEVDGMLRAMSGLEATREQFVGQVVERMEEEDAPASSTVGERLTILVEQVAPLKIPESSIKPPPLPPPREKSPPPVPAARDRQTSAGRDASRRARPPAGSRQLWILGACAAAALLVATSSVVVLFGLQDEPDLASDHDPSPARKENISDPPTPDAPDNVTPGPSRIVEDKLDDPPPVVPDTTPDTVPDEDPMIVKRPIPDDPTPEPRDVTPPQAPVVFARLTKTTDAVWESEPQGELRDEPLMLHEGEVQITMNDGAIVNVRGPAVFQLDSPGSLLMTLGHVHATVPSQATGFTVNTPSSRVVDLGTEFDVDVDDAGATAVRVLRGEVEVENVVDDDSLAKKWSLRDGQFKWLTDGGGAHDWKLAVAMDPAGRGSMNLNGVELPFGSRAEFNRSKQAVMDEMMKFQRDFVGTASEPGLVPYSGVVELDGKSTRFDDALGFHAARRRTTGHFDRMNRLLESLEQFRGSININGTQMNFNNLQELMKAQEEMMRRFQEELDKKDPRGAITIGDAEVDFGNLEELLKAQQDMMRRFGVGGDAVGQLDRAQDMLKETQERMRELSKGVDRRADDARRRHEERFKEHRKRLEELRATRGCPAPSERKEIEK